MTDAPDKRALLDRLRINRDEDDEDNGGNRWLIIAFASLCVLLVTGAIYAFWPKGEPEPAVAATSDTPGTPGAGSTAATGTTTVPVAPSAGGVLSASGYVTARRLATVSTEITGRVLEVLVEEGMTVEANQFWRGSIRHWRRSTSRSRKPTSSRRAGRSAPLKRSAPKHCARWRVFKV